MPSNGGRDIDQLTTDASWSALEAGAQAMWQQARSHPDTASCVCPLVEGLAALYEMGYRLIKQDGKN